MSGVTKGSTRESMSGNDEGTGFGRQGVRDTFPTPLSGSPSITDLGLRGLGTLFLLVRVVPLFPFPSFFLPVSLTETCFGYPPLSLPFFQFLRPFLPVLRLTKPITPPDPRSNRTLTNDFLLTLPPCTGWGRASVSPVRP